MTNRTHSLIDPGSPAYWRDRQRAFRLIRDAELAAQRLAEAPMYLHGGYDEDGDVIAIENLEPPHGIAMCQNEVVTTLEQRSRPWKKLSELASIHQSTFSNFMA